MSIKYPIYITILLLVIVLILWFIPDKLGLINESYNIEIFRSDLKDFALLISIVITLWLVLITQNISMISLNAQKAMNRPYIKCELLVLNPEASNKTGISIISPEGTQYKESNIGINTFLLISNASGGGKAINIELHSKFNIYDSDLFSINRNYHWDLLPSGDKLIIFLYNFSYPSKDVSKIELVSLKIEYTTPFDESSNAKVKCKEFDEIKEITAEGNSVNDIEISKGISIKR